MYIHLQYNRWFEDPWKGYSWQTSYPPESVDSTFTTKASREARRVAGTQRLPLADRENYVYGHIDHYLLHLVLRNNPIPRNLTNHTRTMSSHGGSSGNHSLRSSLPAPSVLPPSPMITTCSAISQSSTQGSIKSKTFCERISGMANLPADLNLGKVNF